MKFVANLSLIFFTVVFLVVLAGCSATEKGRRADIIEQLHDVGCVVSSYKERFGKSVSVNC